MADIIIYAVVIFAVIFRLVIMKGTFVLPTFYKVGNQATFNLGSVSTIIIGILAAFVLMYTQPESFVNPLTAFLVTYSAPQIVDGVITAGTRYADGRSE